MHGVEILGWTILQWKIPLHEPCQFDSIWSNQSSLCSLIALLESTNVRSCHQSIRLVYGQNSATPTECFRKRRSIKLQVDTVIHQIPCHKAISVFRYCVQASPSIFHIFPPLILIPDKVPLKCHLEAPSPFARSCPGSAPPACSSEAPHVASAHDRPKRPWCMKIFSTSTRPHGAARVYLSTRMSKIAARVCLLHVLLGLLLAPSNNMAAISQDPFLDQLSTLKIFTQTGLHRVSVETLHDLEVFWLPKRVTSL